MTFFQSYNPEAFGWVAMADIVPYSYKGYAFPQGVSARAKPLFDGILDALVPRIPGGLHLGWNWGAEDRRIAGSSARSFHSYGIAIDINAPANPMTYGSVQFGDPFVLPPDTGKIVRPFGAQWGGDWSGRKDFMHVELHASPFEVAVLIAGMTPIRPTPYPLSDPRNNWFGPDARAHRTGPHVTRIQRLVGSVADGQYGSKTAGAVADWQRSHKVTPSHGYGRVDDRTWLRMGL